MDLTRKMAHCLQQRVPSDFLPEEALRWAQVRGFGGDEQLAHTVATTRLSQGFANEPFWRTVLLFLVRCGDTLDTSKAPAVVDYIHYRKFESREDWGPEGEPISEPSPEPNLSMKSRSLAKLMPLVAIWREANTVKWEREDHPDSDGVHRKLQFFYCEEEDESTGRILEWTIQELTTSGSLANESEQMNHCLGSYGQKLGKLSLWSVQVRDGDRTHRVLTVSIDLKIGVVKEARGRYNVSPSKEFDSTAVTEPEQRRRGRLNPRDRDLLRRCYPVFRTWLEREGIIYSGSDF